MSTRSRVRRIAIAVGGGSVLAVGLAMTVLPGPAILVVPAGLAILATEFPWARRLLDRVRTAARRPGRTASDPATPPSPSKNRGSRGVPCGPGSFAASESAPHPGSRHELPPR